MMLKNAEMEPANAVRPYPTVVEGVEGGLKAVTRGQDEILALLGMKTSDAASGVFLSALEALGASAQDKAQMLVAMYAEVEPRDGVEAMLVAQMTATHIAMTVTSSKMHSTGLVSVRESHERSMTRLGRTFIAQMEALRKYRAKAQQVVRVERVTVNEGGQAIVGNVQHGGAGVDQS